jgi:hypothetical protein
MSGESLRPFNITLSLPCGAQKRQNSPREILGIIADNLRKAGWSLGWVSALDDNGRTIWIVDAHVYRKRFIVRADFGMMVRNHLWRKYYEN